MRFSRATEPSAVYKAVIAVAVVAALGASAAHGQRATPVASPPEQTIGNDTYTSIFDSPFHYLPREKTFDLVRRAVHETTEERIWAYVPGKLVLLGKETDASVSVEADLEILTTVMKSSDELDLLHTHVKRHFLCINTETPVISSPNDYSCRSRVVDSLRNSVPSPYDSSAAILAADLYQSLHSDSWRLNNFVFTPISEIQYNSTPTGLYRLKLRGDRALRTKIGMIGSYSHDFPEEIVPEYASGALSVEEMRPYVRQLVNRFGQFKEFTMRVVDSN